MFLLARVGGRWAGRRLAGRRCVWLAGASLQVHAHTYAQMQAHTAAAAAVGEGNGQVQLENMWGCGG